MYLCDHPGPHYYRVNTARCPPALLLQWHRIPEGYSAPSSYSKECPVISIRVHQVTTHATRLMAPHEDDRIQDPVSCGHQRDIDDPKGCTHLRKICAESTGRCTEPGGEELGREVGYTCIRPHILEQFKEPEPEKRQRDDGLETRFGCSQIEHPSSHAN